MPIHMKIQVQPVDITDALNAHTSAEPVKQPAAMSRLKRLFERLVVPEDRSSGKDGSTQFEPSSASLAKMVQNFIEGSAYDKHQAGRHSCSCCFNPSNNNVRGENDLGSFENTRITSPSEIHEILRGLVPCSSVKESNLLADTVRIVEKNRGCNRKVIVEGLVALGYDASICNSRWDRSAAYPAAGEYEFIDVKLEGGIRLLVDVDFRSEFEIARQTKSYKSILQLLPFIFVGGADRLEKIVGVVAEAAEQSLKKRGMHVPPWRKAEYLKAKWLSPNCARIDESDCGKGKAVNGFSPTEEKPAACAARRWKPPELKARKGMKVVTGLSLVMEQEVQKV